MWRRRRWLLDKLKARACIGYCPCINAGQAFQQRTEHGTHREGYIDTLQTLDDYKLFSPCYSPTKIFDYYNDRRAEFIGGKGRLRKVLLEKLDTDLLKRESGYLTLGSW